MSDVSFHSSSISRTGTLLARYQSADGPRDVMGFNIGGKISVFDVAVFDAAAPQDGNEVLLIERGVFFWEESLRSFVLDYVEQSERYGRPAVSDSVVAEANCELADVLRGEAERIGG
jgi:hypothetical protein